MDRTEDTIAFHGWNRGNRRFAAIRLQAWLAAIDYERARAAEEGGFGLKSRARREMLKARHSDNSLAHQIAMIERPLAPGEHQHDR